VNTYSFVVEVHGVSLGTKVAFDAISLLFRNSTMSQNGPNEVLVEVVKARTWPEELALNEAALEVDDLLDRIALIDNHRVVSIRYIGYRDAFGTLNEPRRAGGLSATATAGLPQPAKYYGLDQQRTILDGRLNAGLSRLHRIAQGMPDGIGKFLLLYGALQVMHGEKQSKVDEFLLSVRPDTLLVEGKHRRETVVSRLRNQIAHPENEIDARTLTAQASSYCPMLIELVRQDLIRQVRPRPGA
jgi:hypothetical protein